MEACCCAKEQPALSTGCFTIPSQKLGGGEKKSLELPQLLTVKVHALNVHYKTQFGFRDKSV
jgi:hypothetical protein